MTPLALWSRILLGALLAAALPLIFEIPPPTHLRTSPALALATGLTVGAVLYAAVARQRHFPVGLGVRLGVVRATFIVGWAVVEEILWRWLLLGALALSIPTVAAFAAATIAFGLTHVQARGVHLATGATFGGLYLLTGTLLAPIVAHVVYNVLAAGATSAPRPEARLR